MTSTDTLDIRAFNQDIRTLSTRSSCSRNYNEHMGSVDGCDQVLKSMMQHKPKNKKWTTNLCFWFFYASILNVTSLLLEMGVPGLAGTLKQNSHCFVYYQMLRFYNDQFYKGKEQEAAAQGCNDTQNLKKYVRCNIKKCRNNRSKSCGDCGMQLCEIKFEKIAKYIINALYIPLIHQTWIPEPPINIAKHQKLLKMIFDTIFTHKNIVIIVKNLKF